MSHLSTSSFILKVIGDALLIVNQDRFLFMNRALEEMCGTTSSRVLQEPALLLTSEEYVAFFELVGRHLRGEQSSLVEAIIECQHGGTRASFLARVAFHPFHDESDGGNLKCLCVFSEPLFYKTLFENATTMMAILEYDDEPRDCVISKRNTSFERFFSVPPQTGKHVRASDLGLCFDDEDRRFFQQPLPSEPRVRLLRVKASQERWLQVTLTALGCSLRRRSLFLLVGDDVTALTLLKEQLAQERQVSQKQMMFYTKMVHELRAPISSMLGVATLMRSTSLTTEQSDLLNSLQICGDSVLSLIGSVLDLSNLERNSVILERKSFNLGSCIEDALDIGSVQASSKRISLCYEVESVEEDVIGDNLRLRQVVLNLITNAIKFTPEDGHVFVRITKLPDLVFPKKHKHIGIAVIRRELHVHIELHCHSLDARPARESQRVELHLKLFAIKVERLSVVLHALCALGLGVVIDEVGLHIFDAFTQADPSTMKLYGGNGLGLAIVKGIVSLMGGVVQVESELSQGTTITLLIPFQPATTLHMIDWRTVFFGRKALVSMRKPKVAANLRLRLGKLGVQSVTTDQEADVIITDDIFGNRLRKPTILICSRDHFARFTSLNTRQVIVPEPIFQAKLIDSLCATLAVSKPAENRSYATRKRRHRVGSPTLQRRILIVDDNVVNRKVAQQFLETLGYSRACIYTASNGFEAIESLKQHMVDVVLMDVQMPVMDGLTATVEIRKFCQVRIIACTANATNEQRNQCLKVGMDGFLTKPLQREVLEEELG